VNNGSLTLNGITDAQLDTIIRVKEQHEGVIDFNPQQLQPVGGGQPYFPGRPGFPDHIRASQCRFSLSPVGRAATTMPWSLGTQMMVWEWSSNSSIACIRAVQFRRSRPSYRQTGRPATAGRPFHFHLKGIVMANPPKHPGLDGRSRNEDGEIRKKRTDTLVRTLRETYGDDFAHGYRSDAKLGTVLEREGAEDLSDILKGR
jgi:hypothetical protein